MLIIVAVIPQFVDFGNVDNVPLSALIVPPDPILYTSPPLADRFFLAGLGPINSLSWSPSELTYLNSTLVNSEFPGEVAAEGSVGYPATVRLDNPPPMPGAGVGAPAGGGDSGVAMPTPLVVGRCYEVHVTQMDSLMSFFVQPGGTRKAAALAALHARVQSEAAAGGRLAPAQVHAGLHCVARSVVACFDGWCYFVLSPNANWRWASPMLTLIPLCVFRVLLGLRTQGSIKVSLIL